MMWWVYRACTRKYYRGSTSIRTWRPTKISLPVRTVGAPWFNGAAGVWQYPSGIHGINVNRVVTGSRELHRRRKDMEHQGLRYETSWVDVAALALTIIAVVVF